MKAIIDDQIVDLTPELLAEAFANMGSDEQARFYNRLGEVATDWLPFQLQAITDDDGLTLRGRQVMQSIGDYSHWGLVPKADRSFLERDTPMFVPQQPDGDWWK